MWHLNGVVVTLTKLNVYCGSKFFVQILFSLVSGQVSEWIKLPKVFVNLISHSKVKLVGLNIAG